MRKSRRTWVAALIIAATFGVVWLISNSLSSGPVYQRKQLSAWVVQYIESPSGDPSETQAAEAIRRIGTNGIPSLLNWISLRDSPLRDTAITLVRRQSLLKIRSHTAGERRILGRIGFSVLGPAASPAVPQLMDLLEHSGDSDVQANVIMALKDIGPLARDAVPALVARLKGTNHFAAVFAPRALAAIHQQPELTVPALIQHLERVKGWPGDLRDTIAALGSFGNQATSAVPILVTFLNDTDPPVRLLTTNALKQIDPEAAARAGVK